MAFQTEGFRSRLVVVAGDAHGVGSSFVALHAAHHLRERSSFPGGIVWVPPADGVPLLECVGRAIGIGPLPPGPEFTAAALQRLRGSKRRLLVVLDNVACCACLSRALCGGDDDGGAAAAPDASEPCCASCAFQDLRQVLGASDHLHALVATTDLPANAGAQAQPSPLRPAAVASPVYDAARLHSPAQPSPLASPFSAAGGTPSAAYSSYSGVGTMAATLMEGISYDAVGAPAAQPSPPPPPPLLPPPMPMLKACSSAQKLSVFPGSDVGGGGLFFAGGAQPRVVRVPRRKREPRYRGKDDSDSFWAALRLLFDKRFHVPAGLLRSELAWVAQLSSMARLPPLVERPAHTLLEHFSEPHLPRENLALIAGDAAPAIAALRGTLLRSDPLPAMPATLGPITDGRLLELFEGSFLASDLDGSMRAIDALVVAAGSRRLYALPMSLPRQLATAATAAARLSFGALPLDAAAQAVAFSATGSAAATPFPDVRGSLSPLSGPGGLGGFVAASDGRSGGGSISARGAPALSYGPVDPNAAFLVARERGASAFPAEDPVAPPRAAAAFAPAPTVPPVEASPPSRPPPLAVDASTTYLGIQQPAAPALATTPVPQAPRVEDIIALAARAAEAEAALRPFESARRVGAFVIRGSSSKGSAGALAITYVAPPATPGAPPAITHAHILPAPGGGVIVPPNTAPFPSLAAFVEAYSYLSVSVAPGSGLEVPRADVLRLLRAHPVYGNTGAV